MPRVHENNMGAEPPDTENNKRNYTAASIHIKDTGQAKRYQDKYKLKIIWVKRVLVLACLIYNSQYAIFLQPCPSNILWKSYLSIPH